MNRNLLAQLALALGLAAPAVGLQQDPTPDPEASAEGRERYLGREIARTMHWLGAEWLLRETREDEENSALLLANLGLEPGQVVCDLGCGNGYFTLPLARRVGSEGRVFAVDIQEEMLGMLAERVAAAGLSNVAPVLGTVRDPRLPESSCDLVVMVDVYHEISHPVTVLAHLRKALRPGGRLVLVEFRAEDPEVPIKPRHKMTKAQVLTELAANGFRFDSGYDGLPMQHVMAFVPDPASRDSASNEERDPDAVVAEAVAAGLWRSIESGDVLALRGFYAPEVFVQPGSELLKERWGGAAGADREGRTLERGPYLERYSKAIAEVGRDRWRAAFEKRTDTVGVTAGGDWPGGLPGDRRLSAGGGADQLVWYLRVNDAGQWHVVSERTDF